MPRLQPFPPSRLSRRHSVFVLPCAALPPPCAWLWRVAGQGTRVAAPCARSPCRLATLGSARGSPSQFSLFILFLHFFYFFFHGTSISPSLPLSSLPLWAAARETRLSWPFLPPSRPCSSLETPNMSFVGFKGPGLPSLASALLSDSFYCLPNASAVTQSLTRLE